MKDKKEAMAEGRRNGHHTNREKTHCKHGHEYIEENTYLNPKGSRECRVCIKERGKRFRERDLVVLVAGS